MARRKRREGHSLHKVLGVGALFSTAYGNVGSSIYYALGVVAVAALGLTPAVFVITGCLFIATAWSYSEATAAMPEAGGASSFTRRAFNEFASFGIGWAQMLTYTATISISALFVPQYLSIFWPVLKEPPYNVIGGAITIVVLVVLNVVGIKEAASLNVVLALLDLGTQVLIMIIALVLLLEPTILIEQIQWGIAPTWSQFLYGLAMGTVAYTGIETISNMAEEARDPGKDVPRSMNFVIIAVLVVYIGMPLAALSVMNVGTNTVPVDPATGLTVPVEVVPGEPEGTYVLKSDPSVSAYVPLETLADGTVVIPAQEPSGEVTTVGGQQVTELYGTQLGSNYLADPVLGMVRFLPDNVAWLRWILGPWVGILAATILFIATNAGIIGVSRLAFSLGQHRQLPRVLGRVHPTRLTPYVAIILFGIVAIILILPGEIPMLADLYAFGSMIAFTAAHLSVIVLRRKEPDLPRPFRPPFNVTIGKTSVPLTAVFGGLATFSVWCVILYFKPLSGLIGIAWVGHRHRGLRHLPQGAGLLADQDGQVPRPAGDDHRRRRLRPIAGAGARHGGERGDDGARLPAGHRAQVVHRRAVRDRGAAEPADRREPAGGARAGQARARARRPCRGHVQREDHAGRGHGPVGRQGDRRDSHRTPLRGHHPRLAGQAADRRQGLRSDDRPRAQQPALRGHHQRDPQDPGRAGRGRDGRGSGADDRAAGGAGAAGAQQGGAAPGRSRELRPDRRQAARAGAAPRPVPPAAAARRRSAARATGAAARPATDAGTPAADKNH